MEEMRQDITKTQHAADGHRPASVDNRLPASVDDNLPHSHPMKSQPYFHTRAEIDQFVGEIYGIIETTEEMLDRRCDDIYFPMDLSTNALTSKIEAIQREIIEIHGYIARLPEASASIDRRNNKSTDIHRQTSVDEATNRGRQVPKVTSDMSDTHNHGEEISGDTYATLMRHQFNLESLGDKLQNIEDTTAIMKEKWRREDEAMDLDGYARAIDGHALQVSIEDIADILQMANGADNLSMQQRTVPAHPQRVTKEFYDTAGGTDNSFKQKYRHPTRPSIDVDVPPSIDRRPEFGRKAFDLFGTRKFYWKEKDEYGVYRDDQGCGWTHHHCVQG
ncbi:hypothetical protein F2Q69_00058977 [Brassica cretica]|uniref:Uncharacterized protein n=1 Tax=Brassica cretica TaxID=69181 RepID=A0A8S9RPH2_BRACR|nr:hypothetical protein F2Q69_00058977 [Brassica cretica]